MYEALGAVARKLLERVRCCNLFMERLKEGSSGFWKRFHIDTSYAPRNLPNIA